MSPRWPRRRWSVGADSASRRPSSDDARLGAELQAWLDVAPLPRPEALDEVRAKVSRTRQRPAILARQAPHLVGPSATLRLAVGAAAVILVAVIARELSFPPEPAATPRPSVVVGQVGQHATTSVDGFIDAVTITVDGSSVWLAMAGRRLVEVDAVSLRTLRAFSLPEQPCGAPTVVVGAVWIAACDGHLDRVDRIDGRVERFPGAGLQLGFDGTSVWALDALESSLEVRDPISGAIGRSFRLEGQSDRVLAGLGAIWVLRPGDGRVVRVDPVTGEMLGLAVGDRTYAGAIGSRFLWMADLTDGRIVAISGGGAIVDDVVVAGTAPSAIAEAGGLVWALVDDGLVVVDADGLAQVETIDLDFRPSWIAASGSDLWLLDPAGRLLRVDAHD